MCAPGRGLAVHAQFGSSRVQIDGLAGVLFVALPWVALLVLAVALAIGRRLRADPPPAAAPLPPATPVPAPVASEALAVAAAPAARLDERPADARVIDDREQLTDDLDHAIAEGHTALIPGLHLAIARLDVSAGALKGAVDHLVAAIQAASQHNMTDLHALARLELGDLASAHGDMTTACEHWQIARALYQDLGRKADREAATKRMQSNGCPSDWVLNQF
jgi:hypothetical protein